MTRPKIKAPLSKVEIILQILNFTAALALICFLIIIWGKMPDQIPKHFGIDGKVDAWAHKPFILFMPIFGFALNVLLSVLELFPRIYNYPVEITENNAEFMYGNARKMLTWVKFVILLTFSYITVQTARVALGQAKGLGLFFLPVFLVLIFFPTIYYTLKMTRFDKNNDNI